MTAQYRPYTKEIRFTEDFLKVHDFLHRINQENMASPNFLWGRWQWMFSLPFLNEDALDRIGVWEDQERIVALATYESKIGEAYFCLDPAYPHLKSQLFNHARDYLSEDGSLRVILPDGDREFHRLAVENGFRATQSREATAVIDLLQPLDYTLPDGYSVTSLADEYDLIKYNSVLWQGFNHGDTPPQTDKDLEERRISLSGPHVNLNLNIAVKAPNGEFVAYCGMWYLPGSDYALVEPVATVPAYRKMGLGKAAVLEAVKRCRDLGALRAYVGSSQQFYYNIGFAPCHTETWWEGR